MNVFLTILGLVVLVVIVTVIFKALEKKVPVHLLIGKLLGDTCNAQTHEIYRKVLDNQELFNLVKDDFALFTGHEITDSNSINTSKFAKLVAKHATIPTQITTAERYLRNYRARANNSCGLVVNG